jgi:hypothetical protein
VWITGDVDLPDGLIDAHRNDRLTLFVGAGASVDPPMVNRGSAQQAATFLRGITANDEHPTTAHDIAATTASESLPSRVPAAVKCRALAVRNRSSIYRRWLAEVTAFDRDARSRGIAADRSIGEGLEL